MRPPREEPGFGKVGALLKNMGLHDETFDASLTFFFYSFTCETFRVVAIGAKGNACSTAPPLGEPRSFSGNCHLTFLIELSSAFVHEFAP